MPNLPTFCKEHLNAKIRHEWDQKHYVMNGYPAGTGISTNHHYFCDECGLEVCSESEYKNRTDNQKDSTDDIEEERYDCPIHGLQDGPECPRC